MDNSKTFSTTIAIICTVILFILAIASRQWCLLVIGLLSIWSLWWLFSSRTTSAKPDHPTSAQKPEESLSDTLALWKSTWIDKQTNHSTLSISYWENVADEVIIGRLVVLETEKGQNPNTPLGWYALSSDVAMHYLIERNNKAIEREKAGDIEEAIFLYEVSVADAFIGSHPYDRLRILYTRAKQYDEAIRVCRAYLALPDRPNGQNKPRFAEWVEKLEKKRIRHSS